MSKTELGPVVLDDVIIKTIAALEQGQEQLGLMAQTARSEQESSDNEIPSLYQQLQACKEQVSELDERVSQARLHLEGSIQASPLDATRVLEAVNLLTARQADLNAARERELDLSNRHEQMQINARTCNRTAEQGESLLRQMETSVRFVAANFRELGSRLESAQQSRALGLHVIRAQEEERRHLAREIHDGPAQLLNSVVLRIDVCQRLFDADPQRLREELQQLKDLVRLSLQDVRKIIFDLRPMALDDLGLVPALRGFLKDYQAKTGIETDFAVFGNDRRYDSAFEVALFRLVQEALTNVYKHAGAVRVWVKVETTGGREIKLTVKDDGAGFDPQKVRQAAAGTKFGLVGMRERAELLGGSMDVQSALGKGTRLHFLFPLAD